MVFPSDKVWVGSNRCCGAVAINKLGNYAASAAEYSLPMTTPQNENKYIGMLHSGISWSLHPNKWAWCTKKRQVITSLLFDCHSSASTCCYGP